MAIEIKEVWFSKDVKIKDVFNCCNYSLYTIETDGKQRYYYCGNCQASFIIKNIVTGRLYPRSIFDE